MIKRYAVTGRKKTRAHRALSWGLGFSLFLGFVLAAGAQDAADIGLVSHDPQTALSRRLTPVVRVVQENAASVVNISTERIVLLRQVPFWGGYGDDFDLFFDQFFGSMGSAGALKLKSVGSGVIVDPQGLIVTNAHVVNMASNIIVILTDGTSVEGTVVYQNPAQDLALIKIEPPGTLTSVKMGQTGDLMVGETVVAIGDPLGLENSVTAGIVSGVKRKFSLPDGDVVFDDLIQIDAPINPGNSGGALLNINGELIGINMAVVPDYQSIGFAIPVENVKKALSAYRQGDTGMPSTAVPGTAQTSGVFEPGFSQPFSMPDIQIEPDGDGYAARIDIAGLDKDKVNVDLNNGVMTVSGERSVSQKQQGEGATFSMQSYGSFLKSVPMPVDADPSSIKTEIQDETLIVHLSKKPAPEAK